MSLSTKSTADTSQTLRRGGAVASFLMAVALFLGPLIYLFGNLRDAMGALGYSLADLLYGPVLGASIMVVMAALRARMGADAPTRMSLANKGAVLAAGAFVLMACIRAANRAYHLHHPELQLEDSSVVLTVWGTLVAGVNGAAWQFLGWMDALVGWAGWTSRKLPRLLSGLFVLAGAPALFVYQWEGVLEPHAGFFAMAVSVWLGVYLLRSRSDTG